MGTFVAIEAAAPSETIASSAIEAAFAALAEVEQRMHPSREGSDVARINSAPLRAKTPIHASTAEVLTLAVRLNELTESVFDPCLPFRAGRLTDLELGDASTEGAAWVICHAPLALDLGGIAKGYAIDCAVAALRGAGCVTGLVNAGGDLRLFGDRAETMLVRSADGSHRPLVLCDAALAVSDLDETRRPAEHRGYYIRGDSKLRCDAAAALRRHAAVLASDAMKADGLTKCALLCPEESVRRVLAIVGGRNLDSNSMRGWQWGALTHQETEAARSPVRRGGCE